MRKNKQGDLCKLCRKHPVRKGALIKGKRYWRGECGHCHRDKFGDDSYRKYKGSTCEHCGFVAEDPCQLDVDHIDGNHKNNKRENFQTLCANCHRLKTKRTKQGFYPYAGKSIFMYLG